MLGCSGYGEEELSQLEGWWARLVVMPMLQWWDFRVEGACGKSLVCATWGDFGIGGSGE